MPPKPSSGLSDGEIAQVVEELEPVLAGGAVGKVWELGGHTLTLEVGRQRLVLSAHPRASRLHLGGGSSERGEPTSLARLLRKRLGGLRLVSLRVLAPGERVVELEFGPGRERLVAELTGPHANLFLLGADGTVVASLRPSSSTTRPLGPGAPWIPPPPAPPDARWRGLARFGDPPGVAERVAAHYRVELERAALAELRERVSVALRRDIDRLHRRERALVGDRARANDARRLRKYGDLLFAHLQEVPGRGATSVTLPDDFEEGAPLTIVLDPALDARQNAIRFYRQHKRLTGGLERIDARLARTRELLARREGEVAALPTLDRSALEALAPAQAPRRRRRGPTPERLPYREFRSLDGQRIWVGRSAADNDALTLRHARGNDLWLHTRDVAGPHVVVPLAGRPYSEATLLDAATLAAHFSPLRGEAQVDVTYTAAKNVRKPRGAAAGLVFVSDARTLRVRIEMERLERLLSEDE